LGLAAITKTALLPLWPAVMIRRRTTAGWATITALATAVLVVGKVGWAPWVAYAQRIPQFVGSPVQASTDYQTFHSMALHLFKFDQQWSPSPLMDAPPLATFISVTGRAAFLAYATWIAIKAPPRPAAVAMLAPVCAVMPVAEDHHFVLVIPALVIAWTSPRLAGQALGPLLLAVATLLLGLPFDSVDVGAQERWMAVANYPRVFGCGLLLVWAGLAAKPSNPG
jgi:hypothetical protein